MASAVKSRKDSAQSPAWRRNALPVGDLGQGGRAAARASPAKTSGGRIDSDLRVGLEVGRVGPVRLLGGRQVPPRARGPGLCPPLQGGRPTPETQCGIAEAAPAGRSVTEAPPVGSGRRSDVRPSDRADGRADRCVRWAPSIRSTSAIWSPRSTPVTPCDLDRVILMVANVPWQKIGGRAGQLGRGPPGRGRGRGRRRARPRGRPARDRSGRRVLHRRHPGRTGRGGIREQSSS